MFLYYFTSMMVFFLYVFCCLCYSLLSLPMIAKLQTYPVGLARITPRFTPFLWERTNVIWSRAIGVYLHAFELVSWLIMQQLVFLLWNFGLVNHATTYLTASHFAATSACRCQKGEAEYCKWSLIANFCW